MARLSLSGSSDMQKIHRAMATPGVTVQRTPRGTNTLQDLQSGRQDKLRGKLNLFQAMMLRWRELHPYIAVHIVRLNQPLEPTQLKRRIEGRLETAGLTGLVLDRRHGRFEFRGGAAAIEPTILAVGSDANRVTVRAIARQLNVPSHWCGGFVSVRFSAGDAGASVLFVVCYFQR